MTDSRNTSCVRNASGFILEMTRHGFVHAGGLHGKPSAQVHQVTCDGKAEAHTGDLGHGRVWSITAGRNGGGFVSQTYGLTSFHSLYLQEPRGDALLNDGCLQRESTVSAINGHKGMMVGNEWE